MYGFVDTTESASSTSTSIKTLFNGHNFDEVLTDPQGDFKTLTISGRDIVSRRIRTREALGMDGEVEDGYTVDVRLITVKYMLSDKTNEGFRSRFERLNGFLIGSKKTLEFTDEDAFFTATLQNGDTPEEDSNSIVGTLTFLCSDPAKKRARQLTIDSVLTSTIGGHSSGPWRTKTTFTANQSSYEIKFNAPGKSALRNINFIKLNYNFIKGDVLEIDYRKREVTVSKIDITNTVIILQSNFMELPIGNVEFSASHITEFYYNERYY